MALLIDWLINGVRLRLWTASTNGSIVHPPDNGYGERRWNDIDRIKPKNSKKNLSQSHFVHHKSHVDLPGREPVQMAYKKIINFWTEIYFIFVVLY
jgi:hypothetical protein